MNIMIEVTSSRGVEFEEDLKRQLLDAKQKNRQLQSQIDEFMLKQKLPADTFTDNTIINSHIRTINETVGESNRLEILIKHIKTLISDYFGRYTQKGKG